MKLIPILLFISISSLFAQKAEIIEWKSENTAPAFKAPKNKNLAFTSFQMMLKTVSSERLLMKGVSLSHSIFQLEKEQAETLASELNDYYKIISKDEGFNKIPSMLSYNFSTEKPKLGQALLVQPETPTPDSPVIVFLHGYAGNFIYYSHILSRTFPDAIIISPSYGVSCANVPQDYIDEAITSTEALLNFKLNKPHLIGLSAGAKGGFKLYSNDASQYRSFYSLAGAPDNSSIRQSNKNHIFYLLAGKNESFVKSGYFEKQARKLHKQSPQIKAFLIPKADHFFLLTHLEETQKTLRTWAARDNWYSK